MNYTPFWIALFSAVLLLAGHWATGRLFSRMTANENELKKLRDDVEKKFVELDKHFVATDTKVEIINGEGSKRFDAIQKQYWELMTKLQVKEAVEEALEKEKLKQHSLKEGKPWPQRS